MDHHTREAVGQLSRWCLLGGAAVLALLAVIAELGALEPTFQAARARAVMPDAVSRVETHARLSVISRPDLDQHIPGYYWQGPQGHLSEVSIGRTGIGYFRLPNDVAPGRLGFHAVVNPYSTYAPGWGGATVFLYARRTPLVVLDTRPLLTGADDGRLSRGELRVGARPGTLWLARLAEVRPLAYLTPAPLDAYDACRHALRQAPSGAVLAAADTWETPADVEAMLDALGNVRKRVGGPVTLVTTDAALAEAARRDAVTVVLVGTDISPAAPGLNAPDWDAAYDWLTDQAQ